MATMKDHAEKMGLLIDEIENLAHALNLPMGADFHVQQLQELLPEKVDKLKDIYKDIFGDDPWA